MARDRERDARSTQSGRDAGESANLDQAATDKSAQSGSTSGTTGESAWAAGERGQGSSQVQGGQRGSFYNRASERLSRRSGQSGPARYGAQGGSRPGQRSSGQGSSGQSGYGQGGFGQSGRSQGDVGAQRGYGGASQQQGYQGGSQGGYQSSGQGGYQSSGSESGGFSQGGYQGAASQGSGFEGGNQGGYQRSQQGGSQRGYQARGEGSENVGRGRDWREQGSGRSASQSGSDAGASTRGETFRADERAGGWQSGAGQGEAYGAQTNVGRGDVGYGSAGLDRGGQRDWPGDQYSRSVEGGYQAAGGAAAGFAAGYGAGQGTAGYAGGYGSSGYAGTERDASADVGLGYRDFGEGREAGRRTRWRREPTTARDVMTKNPKSVTRNASIREIAQIMRDESTGIVPVVEDNGKLLGVVTDRDIVMRALAEGKNPLDQTAGDVMTDDVEAVTPDEALREVVDLMGNKQIRRVPVVDQNDRLVGIISMGDVATRADYDEDLQDALEEISARRSFWSKIFG